MATPTNYRITLKPGQAGFIHFETLFVPGQKYVISARVYDSTVGAVPFKELCATAEPLDR